MKRNGPSKNSANPSKSSKVKDDSTVQVGAYNPYIHGTTSAAFATMVRDGDFALKSPALMASEGKAPITGEINNGGLEGNQFSGCNPCFGQVQSDGRYGFKEVESYALAKRGTTKATCPEFDLSDQLRKGSLGLTDINLLNLYLLRTKQMGQDIELELFNCSELKLPIQVHFDLNLQLHYFYLGLGKALSPNQDLYEKIEKAKMQPAFKSVLKKILGVTSLKTIIHQAGTDLAGIWEADNTTDLSKLLSCIQDAFNAELQRRVDEYKAGELRAWGYDGNFPEVFYTLFELMNKQNEPLFKLGKQGYDQAFRNVDLLYVPEQSNVNAVDYINSLDHSEWPRFYIIFQDNEYTLCDTQELSLTHNSSFNPSYVVKDYNLNNLVTKGIAHLKNVGSNIINECDVDNQLRDSLKFLSDDDVAFVGDMSQVVIFLLDNYLGFNELALKQASHLEKLEILRAKYQTFMQVLGTPSAQYKLTEEQLELQNDTVPVIFALEDPTLVAPIGDSGEYRSIEPRVGIGRHEAIKTVASDTLANAHRLGKFLNEKGIYCHFTTFEDMPTAPLSGPKSKLTHQDGLPRLAWLAVRSLEKKLGGNCVESEHLEKAFSVKPEQLNP